MKILKAGVIAMLLEVCALHGYAQGEIPVNMYTGTPIVTVPIINLVSSDLSDNIALNYSAKGLRFAETNGQFGVSWSLSAGGSISREVRGLPDDYTGIGNDQRRGWLYAKYNTSTLLNVDVATTPNATDLSSATCSDELNDYVKIFGYGYNNDTEPDIFHYNVGGLSGSFVFDNSTVPVIRLIPFQDIKIEPRFGPGTKTIFAFTITTNTGLTYEFDPGLTESRCTKKKINESTVEFFKTDYELYALTAAHDNKPVYYTKEWNLSYVRSISGHQISYGYSSEEGISTKDVKVLMLDAAYLHADKYKTVIVYRDSVITTTRDLVSVGTNFGPGVSLNSSDGVVASIAIRDSRGGSNYNSPYEVKSFVITYSQMYDRKLIKKIQEIAATDSITPYIFNYYSGYVPPSNTKAQDIWGYFNGKPNQHLIPTLFVYPGLSGADRFRTDSIPGYVGTYYKVPGADRRVDPQSIQAGTLRSIKYPAGGLINLEYEPNQYYDPVTSQTTYGGGLRIKSMNYKDGLNPDVKIEKSFTYTTASGACSGKLINRPVFGMITWEYRDPNSTTEISTASQSGNWSKFIVGTETDLTPDQSGNYVAYTDVKVQRNGEGYVRFQYEVPLTYTTSTSGDWQATTNKFARSNMCTNLGFAADASGINNFPYAPNPEFQYAFGSQKCKRTYNEAGALIEKVSNSYQYIYKSGSTPYKVWGLNFEKNPNSDDTMYFFGKYFLLTDVAKVPLRETVIRYDAADSTKKLTEVTEFNYESANHKLVTKIKRTASDGSEHATYMKYPLDYGTIPVGADKASETIGTLKATGRNGTPVEIYNTVKNGSDEYVVAGSITKYSDFGMAGKVLPQYSLTWNSAEPELLSSFTPSYVNTTTNLFTTDNNYAVANTILVYDNICLTPIKSVNRSRVNSYVVLGYNGRAPIVVTQDLDETMFAFSDFEISSPVAFTANPGYCFDCFPQTTPVVYTAGRTGNKGVEARTVNLSKSITKTSSSYRFSGWVKHNGSPITFELKLRKTIGDIVYLSQTFTYTPTKPNGSWEYFEKVIPATDVPSTEFIFEVSAPEMFGMQLDDIAFAPVEATLQTFTYQFPFGVTSSTINDKTIKNEYDAFGRVRIVRDRDGNILQRTTYTFNQE